MSYCVLFDDSEETNLDARARIDAMTRTTDGFELADEDLRLRGEGTLFDTRQSGMPDLKLARLAEDLDLVKRARARAFDLIADDPELERHPELLGRAAGAVRGLDRLAVQRVASDRSAAAGDGSILAAMRDRRQRQGEAARARPPGVRPVSDKVREGVSPASATGSRARGGRPLRGTGAPARGSRPAGRGGALRRAGLRGAVAAVRENLERTGLPRRPPSSDPRSTGSSGDPPRPGSTSCSSTRRTTTGWTPSWPSRTQNRCSEPVSRWR